MKLLNLIYTENGTTNKIINYLIAVLIFLIFYLLSNLITIILLKIFKVKKDAKSGYKNNVTFVPISFLIKVVGAYLGFRYLQIDGKALEIVEKIFKITIICTVTKIFINMVDTNSPLIVKIHKRLGTSKNDTMSSVFSKLLKLLIYIISGFIIITELGYDINGLITGLGLSSIVVALAAQDTAKNLFGGFIVIFDKIFKINDWIEINDIEGIVEEITLRSTRIRTFKNSLITIPNSVVADSSIINWSKAKKRRINMDLEISYSASLKSLCNFENDILLMLEEDEMVNNEDIRVKFKEISTNGYDIHISFYTPITDYTKYLSVKENTNYKIMQILNKHKLDLAYPSQEIYIRK